MCRLWKVVWLVLGRDKLLTWRIIGVRLTCYSGADPSFARIRLRTARWPVGGVNGISRIPTIVTVDRIVDCIVRAVRKWHGGRRATDSVIVWIVPWEGCRFIWSRSYLRLQIFGVAIIVCTKAACIGICVIGVRIATLIFVEEVIESWKCGIVLT